MLACLGQLPGDSIIKTLFVKGPFLSLRLTIAAVLSVALLVADVHFGVLNQFRSWLVTGLSPVTWLGQAPDRLSQWFSDTTVSRKALLDTNESLRARLLVLERRAQRYAAQAAENNRLRELLNAASLLDDTAIVAEVIGVSPDPFVHELIINKGAGDGVVEGQAVLDAQGLMGQIVQTSQFSSRLLLISDSSHAVPVSVERNGVRAVLLGAGVADRLELAYVPDTADILVGDQLVSSGLGGRFPKGYPAAVVTQVEHDPGEPFAHVTAKPNAYLDRSELVLVLFKGGAGLPAAETGTETGQLNAVDEEPAEKAKKP